MDNSVSDQNKTYQFQQHSINNALDDSNTVGLNASIRENHQLSQEEAFERLTLDWEMLEQEPILLRQTAKIFEERTNDPNLSTLSAECRALSQKLSQSESLDKEGKQTQEISERTKILNHLEKLQENLNSITDQFQQRQIQTWTLGKQNRLMINQINELKKFVKEMATHQQSNPFAKIQDQKYKDCLMRVSSINEELGKRSQKALSADQNDIERLKINHPILIEVRSKWLQIVKQLDLNLKQLITQEEGLLSKVEKEIIEARDQRGNNSQKLLDQEGIFNIKTNIIPDLIEETINKTYTTEKDSQNIGKPLEEYFAEIDQLSRERLSLQAKLKSNQSIVCQKTSKCALLQKQSKQLGAELKKLQNLNQSETQDATERDGVNYEALIMNTYELENHKRTERLEDRMVGDSSSELPKPSQRIVVGKQTLNWTQKLFLFIKDYKQLINWGFILWVVLILLFVTQKSLVKSGLWSSSQSDFDLEFPEKPVVHTIQTKHKIGDDYTITNKSHNIDDLVKESDYAKDTEQQRLLELKRKQMEQVNFEPIREKDDWKRTLENEFQ